MGTATKAAGESVRMRVTPEERRLILARRSAEPPYRIPVISGYREPEVVPELVEVVRTFLESNFGWCINEHRRDMCRLEIQGDLYGERLPYTSIYFAEEDFPDGSLPTLEADELAILKKYRDDRGAARLARMREAARARKGVADA